MITVYKNEILVKGFSGEGKYYGVINFIKLFLNTIVNIGIAAMFNNI